jgi:predicted carbohydrate-binding protein with CBM5 and CBM33 domain
MEVWSMPAYRKVAALAAAGMAPLLFTAFAASPASAHGAPDSPISRGVACGLKLQQNAQNAACKAAIAASSGEAFKDWDNVRVPDVGGRDREVIPDGQLCSGGIDRFKGLDLPRTDWPSTKLTAGAPFTFTYRETIPHEGTFKFFVTRDGYSPTRALAWSDLEDEPFLQATDPKLVGDAYVMKGKLPQGKSGRHMIFTIWQNTSTPDTYYSCSDVVFGGGAPQQTAPAAPPKVVVPGAPAGVNPPPDRVETPTSVPTTEPPLSYEQPAGGAGGEGAPLPVSAAGSTERGIGAAMVLTAGGAAALAGVGATAVVLIRRRRMEPEA